MSTLRVILLCIFLTGSVQTFAQDEFIYTKEGQSILNRRQLIANCLRGLNKDRTDQKSLTICECQTNKLDWQFTRKQYRKYTSKGIIDIGALIKEDSLFEKEIRACYGNSGITILLQAESFQSDFITDCMEGIKKNTEKKLDSNRLKAFCNCQLNLIKTKKITDAEMKALSNPNTLLFFEIMYKCGDPFMEKSEPDKNWNAQYANDITGPEIDTVKVLSLHGMTYVKIRTGSMVQVWLFDTGASDLLITKDMEAELKKENIITEQNYLGTGEYEMANGMVDTCRKYTISNVQLGQFYINNIVVAVSDKARRIIVGKGLLNKFSNWSLNNKDNTLTLTK
jgi:hypothetical protein